jgi:hypothetical protein
MPFVDATGTNHPNSVWLLADCAESIIDLDTGLSFYGYDADADLINNFDVTLGKPGTKFNTVGEKHYDLSMPEFEVLANTISQAGESLEQITFTDAVGFAQDVLDTPTGTNNPDGTPVLAPYFAGATVGSITVTGATG